MDFSVTYSSRPYHDPGIDSAPSENECQEYFLGVNAAGAWGWQPHHLHVPNVMEIWELKTPGALWATPGLLRDCFTFLRPWLSDCDASNLCRALKHRQNFVAAEVNLHCKYIVGQWQWTGDQPDKSMRAVTFFENFLCSTFRTKDNFRIGFVERRTHA